MNQTNNMSQAFRYTSGAGDSITLRVVDGMGVCLCYREDGRAQYESVSDGWLADNVPMALLVKACDAGYRHSFGAALVERAKRIADIG